MDGGTARVPAFGGPAVFLHRAAHLLYFDASAAQEVFEAMHEFFSHTGDIGVRIWAGTAEGLFAAAVQAFADTITDAAAVRAIDAAALTLRAPGLDLLLHDFLGELLFDFDARQRLVARAEVVLEQEAGGWVLTATTRGETMVEGHHAIKVLIKGITYHALDVTEAAGQWTATVVFDV